MPVAQHVDVESGLSDAATPFQVVPLTEIISRARLTHVGTRGLAPRRWWSPQEGLAGPTRRVADVLRANGPQTRSELAHLTHLSRVTVLNALAELDAHGLLRKEVVARQTPSARGRSAEAVGLSRRAGLVAGIEIGRQRVCVVAQEIGSDEHRVGKQRLGDPNADPQHAFDVAARLLEDALAALGGDRRSLVCACVGISAPVTFDEQIGSQILGEKWNRDHPIEALRQWLDCPVLLDNDANLGALAEYTIGVIGQSRRGGAHVRCMLYVKAATGIGGGIIINGEVFRGASGTAGEIGHITLDPSGDPCRCGNRGCVELIAGGGELLRLAQKAHPTMKDLSELVKLANAKDSVCRRLIADAGRQIGTALGAVVGLYNPDAIVIGGTLAEAGELLVEKIRSALEDAVMPAALGAVREIVKGTLGIEASARGGVMRLRRTADLPL